MALQYKYRKPKKSNYGQMMGYYSELIIINLKGNTTYFHMCTKLE